MTDLTPAIVDQILETRTSTAVEIPQNRRSIVVDPASLIRDWPVCSEETTNMNTPSNHMRNEVAQVGGAGVDTQQQASEDANTPFTIGFESHPDLKEFLGRIEARDKQNTEILEER